MKRFIERTKQGYYDTEIVLYDKNKYPFYKLSTTSFRNVSTSVRLNIENAIFSYKVISCFNDRKDGDPNKYVPVYAKIFTTPAYNEGVFKINGRQIKDVNLEDFKDCTVEWF